MLLTVFLGFHMFSYVFSCFSMFSTIFSCFPMFSPVFSCISVFPCFLLFSYVFPCLPLFSYVFSCFPSMFFLFFYVFLGFPMFSYVLSCFPMLLPAFLCFSLFSYTFSSVFRCFPMLPLVFLCFSLFSSVFLCFSLFSYFFSLVFSFFLLFFYVFYVFLCFALVFPCFPVFSPGFLCFPLFSIFIMGDFNINLLNCESHPESNDFLLMLNSFFLLPYILQPTSITERSATLTDNIFANTYAMNAISSNLVSKISDHLPQFLIVDNLKVNYKVLNYYKKDFSKFNEEKFINDFSLLDWNSISSDYMDANTKFDIFYDQISQFINSHVQRRKLSKREIKLSTKLWITKPILAKIRYRDIFKSKFDIPS